MHSYHFIVYTFWSRHIQVVNKYNKKNVLQRLSCWNVWSIICKEMFMTKDWVIYFVICYILGEFQTVMNSLTTAKKFPFPFDTSFCNYYFGKDRKNKISYPEFTQFIQVSVEWICYYSYEVAES